MLEGRREVNVIKVPRIRSKDGQEWPFWAKLAFWPNGKFKKHYLESFNEQNRLGQVTGSC